MKKQPMKMSLSKGTKQKLKASQFTKTAGGGKKFKPQFTQVMIPIKGKKIIYQTVVVPAGTDEVIIRVLIGHQRKLYAMVGSKNEVVEDPNG